MSSRGGAASEIERMALWMDRCLGCVAGRREHMRGRYFMTVVSDRRSVLDGFARFEAALHRRETVAGLFLLSDSITADVAGAPVAAQMRRIAEVMAPLGDVPVDGLVDGRPLSRALRLPCPVTGQSVLFDDFDAVAFCPSSHDEGDPLYDPMMGAPVLCANVNSDIYAFSMFVRDTCLQRHGCEVPDLADPADRTALFEHAGRLWQRFARRTIANYVAITDTAKCPTRLAPDERHWYASHQDPAFAETRKELYRHDMPVLYTARIAAAWTRHFEGGAAVSLAGATPPGDRREAPV